MIHPNELPDAPEWVLMPRECPIPCPACERPAFEVGPNIELGSN